MLALNPFGTATTSEASQKAEEFSNAKPSSGEGNVYKKIPFSEYPGGKGGASI